MVLADYVFTTEYIKGELNVVADAMSRCVKTAETEDKVSMSFKEYMNPASAQEIQDIYEAEQVKLTRALMARSSQPTQEILSEQKR